jgi:phage gp45-like
MAIIMVVIAITTAVSRVTKLKAGTTAITTRAKVKIVVGMAIITKPKAKVMVAMETITSMATTIMVIIMAATTTIIEDTTNLTDAGMDTTDHTDRTLTGMGTDHMLITHSPTIHMYLLQLI